MKTAKLRPQILLAMVILGAISLTGLVLNNTEIAIGALTPIGPLAMAVLDNNGTPPAP